MNSFAFVAVLAAVAIAGVAANSGSLTQSSVSGSASGSLGSNLNQDLESELPSVQTAQLNSEFGRFRKSAGYGGGASAGGYGGAASIPAPPCPKNYLFSCQPNLAPVPCAAPAPSGGYGSSGAYSAPVGTYVAPLGNNYGLPQGYNGLAPQFYHY